MEVTTPPRPAAEARTAGETGSAPNPVPPVRFFLPGPTWVNPEVREAMTAPPVAHRSPEFKALYASVTERLKPVFRTAGDVLTATGSATLVMESAVVSTVSENVLNLVCGAFSERWHAISRAAGKRADRVAVPWGRAVDPELVRQALRRKRYEAVTVVHNETSTGVIQPLEEIARVVREQSDALVLVDAVSSLGGAPVETDAWGLDVVLTASQKALAVPPGLALLTLSERAAARAERIFPRGFYTDLLRYRRYHRERGGTITTPAEAVFHALDRQLARVLAEGMETRWARHRRLREAVGRWARERGLRFASAEGFRSPTVSCLEPPPGVEAPALVAALARRGVTVGGGYGDWKPTTFRIGHMGEVRDDDLAALFPVLDETLDELGG
jgi:aspartate aminotransferase-like enzyme